MTQEVKEYAEKRILESGIRMVSGHYPEFKSREHVDLWLKISKDVFRAKALVEMEPEDSMEMNLTNEEISAIFTDIYNGFWMQHRDHIPERSDEAGWDAIMEESKVLMEKYNCQLARDLVANLVVIMDQRMREKVHK